MEKKKYIRPCCAVISISATPILAGSPPSPSISSKMSGGPALNNGGSTDDEENEQTTFNPW